MENLILKNVEQLGFPFVQRSRKLEVTRTTTKFCHHWILLSSRFLLPDPLSPSCLILCDPTDCAKLLHLSPGKPLFKKTLLRKLVLLCTSLVIINNENRIYILLYNKLNTYWILMDWLGILFLWGFIAFSNKKLRKMSKLAKYLKSAASEVYLSKRKCTCASNNRTIYYNCVIVLNNASNHKWLCNIHDFILCPKLIMYIFTT